MIARLPSSDSHLNFWKDIVTMDSAPLIQVERVFLTEFLKLFIIPALEKSQTNDEQMGVDAGYLARLWPVTVRSHIVSIKSYQEFPEKIFPATEAHLGNSLKDVDHANFFRNSIQAPFLKEAAASITQHGGSWLEFPKLFAAGADSHWNNLFLRSVLRNLNSLSQTGNTFFIIFLFQEFSVSAENNSSNKKVKF